MVGNASDELFSGFWRIMRRFLFTFLRLWVVLIAYSANINVIISAILAGASVSLVAIYEKKKILSENAKQNDGNKVIK